jgi:hypothetical protein
MYLMTIYCSFLTLNIRFVLQRLLSHLPSIIFQAFYQLLFYQLFFAHIVLSAIFGSVGLSAILGTVTMFIRYSCFGKVLC